MKALVNFISTKTFKLSHIRDLKADLDSQPGTILKQKKMDKKINLA